MRFGSPPPPGIGDGGRDGQPGTFPDDTHRVVGVLHRVVGVLHQVVGVLHRVLGVLHSLIVVYYAVGVCRDPLPSSISIHLPLPAVQVHGACGPAVRPGDLRHE